MPSVELPQGTIHYRDEGRGPTLVFVHGVLADGQVWSEVIERLSGRFRCLAPDLPLGAHRTPMRPDADLGMSGQARLLGDFLEALDLRDVTLVGNDTGGAVCQLLVATAPPRVTGLVLTDCDALERFPPPGFGYLLWAPKIPGLMAVVFAAMRRSETLRRLPTAFGALTYRRLDDALLRSFVEPGATQPGIRADVRRLLHEAGPHVTLEVAERLHRFPGRVLLLWSADDRFFPLELGRRLAARFAHAELEVVPHASLWVPLDAPDVVAAGIERFASAARA